MALEYILGNFKTGEVIARNLPVTSGTDKVDRNINGGTLEIEVSKSKLTSEQRNNWKTYFKPFARYIALDDKSKAWDDPNAILFAGFINKRVAPVGKGFIRLQTAEMNEYIAARLLINAWDGVVTDPNKKFTFTGASWGGVMAEIVKKAFSAEGIPAGAPKPPAIVGSIAYDAGTTVSKDVTFTDAMSVRDALEDIRDNDSPNGVEWRWVARWTSASRDVMEVNFITGTATNPHINQNIVKTIELSPDEAEKMSSFSESIDSRDIYNTIYIQSKAGDSEAGTGADLQVQFSTDDPDLPLVEKFFNAGVELTQDEINAHAIARLQTGLIGSLDVSLQIEEAWDRSEWVDNIGKKIVFTGVPDSISADHSVAVRCVGVVFSAQKDTIEVSLMQLQNNYPVLPKDKKPFGNKNDYNSAPLSRGLAPYTPPALPPIGVGGGVDGMLSPLDLWGSEGHKPWDIKKPALNNITFANFLEKEYTYTDFEGKYPIDPMSAFLDGGNRIYGLDHINQAAATNFTTTAPTHYLGGVNKDSGLPNYGWDAFYVKKTFVVDGELGPVENIDVISSSMIQSMLAEYEDQPYSNGGYYRTSVTASNWTAAGRYYFCLLHHYDHSDKTDFTSNKEKYNTAKYIANSRISIISKAISDDNGGLVGDWRTEDKNLLPDFYFPLNKSMAKLGKDMLFTNGFMVYPRKVKNENVDTLGQKAEEYYSKFNLDNSYFSVSATGDPVDGTIIYPAVSRTLSFGWPYNGRRMVKPAVLRVGFEDKSTSWGMLPRGDVGNSASSEGYLAIQDGGTYMVEAPSNYVRLRSDKTMDSAFIHNPVVGAEFGPKSITVSGGNFIFFGLDSDSNPVAVHINASMPQGTYKSIKNDIVPKFQFWQNGSLADNIDLYDRSGFREYWGPSSPALDGVNIPASDVISYDGTIYQFVIAGENKITLHSTQVIEDPNPPTPPTTP